METTSRRKCWRSLVTSFVARLFFFFFMVVFLCCLLFVVPLRHIMGTILQYIDSHNEGNFKCYSTKKTSLDDNNTDTISAENSDTDTTPMDTKGKFAEDDGRLVNTVKIHNSLIINTPPYFKYFLDGSRHTYKVDDIAIGNKIFPIVAGQIVVGCCYRPNRDTFKKADLEHDGGIRKKIVISLPKKFHTKGKPDDYARAYCEQINTHLAANNRFASSRGTKIGKIVFYQTDGPSVADVTDKNRYKNSAIAQIQNEMTDEEQLLVNDLCMANKLSSESWLIKDGSLQYNPRFSNIDHAQWNNMRSNYKYVVGVSKSFDPDLLKNHKGEKLSQTIATLKPFERTKAYKYVSEHSNGMTFAVWYLRLRKSDFRETHFSDVIKCEMLLLDPSHPIKTSTIDAISANLIREAYPVCFGSDTRWANHLYPIYLTETFCKSHYIDSNIFLSLF